MRCEAAGLDVWLILCQEDDPDPLFKTMIPMDTWSPILSMLAFVNEGASVRRYNICGTNTKDLYERLYDGQLEEKQWPRLVELLEARDPRTIGINTGSVAWAGGGLTQFLYRSFSRSFRRNITRASCLRKRRRCNGRARSRKPRRRYSRE